MCTRPQRGGPDELCLRLRSPSRVPAARPAAAGACAPGMAAVASAGVAPERQQRPPEAANLVFINIDWRSTRHRSGAVDRNLRILERTIGGVVRHMDPAVVCMCEVGEAKCPLSPGQLDAMAATGIRAWAAAVPGAAKAQSLRSFFEAGAPYVTIYDDRVVQCTGIRTFRELYQAGGEPRTAQAFLCVGPGKECIDVINVHAPSGKRPLSQKQRRTLLSRLLQSASQAMPGVMMGGARCLIGGDMNTSRHGMRSLLDELALPAGRYRIHESSRVPPQHGDLCLCIGVGCEALGTIAPNHDSKHDPYGVRWRAEGSAAGVQSAAGGAPGRGGAPAAVASAAPTRPVPAPRAAAGQEPRHPMPAARRRRCCRACCRRRVC